MRKLCKRPGNKSREEQKKNFNLLSLSQLSYLKIFTYKKIFITYEVFSGPDF